MSLESKLDGLKENISEGREELGVEIKKTLVESMELVDGSDFPLIAAGTNQKRETFQELGLNDDVDCYVNDAGHTIFNLKALMVNLSKVSGDRRYDLFRPDGKIYSTTPVSFGKPIPSYDDMYEIREKDYVRYGELAIMKLRDYVSDHPISLEQVKIGDKNPPWTT